MDALLLFVEIPLFHKNHLDYLAGVGFEPTQHSDYEPDELPITLSRAHNKVFFNGAAKYFFLRSSSPPAPSRVLY